VTSLRTSAWEARGNVISLPKPNSNRSLRSCHYIEWRRNKLLQNKKHRDRQRMRRLGLLFAFFSIFASVVFFGAVAISLRDCSDCSQRSPMLVPMMAILGTLLLFLGISILTEVCRKRKSRLTRTPRVGISSIPAQDLEKSPAPTYTAL